MTKQHFMLKTTLVVLMDVAVANRTGIFYADT